MSLKDDIRANPNCAQAIANKDCQEIARIFSQGRTKTQKVLIKEIQSDLQGTGSWWVIKSIAANANHPAKLAAEAVLDVGNARYDSIDTTLPIVQQSLTGLVASQAITQEQMDKILTMGIVQDPVTPQQVAEALFNIDGTEK